MLKKLDIFVEMSFASGVLDTLDWKHQMCGGRGLVLQNVLMDWIRDEDQFWIIYKKSTLLFSIKMQFAQAQILRKKYSDLL